MANVNNVEKLKELKKYIFVSLSSRLKSTRLSNKEMISKIEKAGFSISSSTFSDIKNAKSTNITLDNLLIICLAMEWDISDFLPKIATGESVSTSSPNFDNSFYLTENSTPNKILPHRNPIFSSSENSFIRQWRGVYEMVFFPTAEAELYPIKGKLFIGEDIAGGSYDPCRVVFEFRTGKESVDHKPTVKRYYGSFLLATRTHTAHITLVWPEFGEITYLSIIDPVTATEGVKCAVGMALTVSSGTTRVPTSHRVIISRDPISETNMSLIRGLLFMNESDILITKSDYNKMLEDEHVPKSYFNTFLNPNNSQHEVFFPHPEVFYRIREDKINAIDEMKSADKLLFLTLLREYSLSRRYLKLGQIVSEDLYKMLYKYNLSNE